MTYSWEKPSILLGHLRDGSEYGAPVESDVAAWLVSAYCPANKGKVIVIRIDYPILYEIRSVQECPCFGIEIVGTDGSSRNLLRIFVRGETTADLVRQLEEGIQLWNPREPQEDDFWGM